MINKKKNKGGTLIEVLIAVVILSIGMLAIAGSLLVSLKNSQNSMKHSQAIAKASSMMEVLRNNKSQAIIGNYNLPNWTCTKPAVDNPIGEKQAFWIAELHNEVDPSACGKIYCTSLSCKISIKWNSGFINGNKNTVSFDSYSIDTRI